MKIVVAPRARRDLLRQLDYLIDHDAAPAARRLKQRLISFIERTLAVHPRLGTYVDHRDLWESWVPRTRLVVWYRFTETEFEIVRIWHVAQDRQHAP